MRPGNKLGAFITLFGGMMKFHAKDRWTKFPPIILRMDEVEMPSLINYRGGANRLPGHFGEKKELRVFLDHILSEVPGPVIFLRQAFKKVSLRAKCGQVRANLLVQLVLLRG